MVVAVLLLPVVVRPRVWRRRRGDASMGWLGTATASGVLVAGVVLAIDVVHGRAVTALGGVLRVDALSAFMVIVIGVIAMLATLARRALSRRRDRGGPLHAAPRLALLRLGPGASWPPCSWRCWLPTWACCGSPSRRPPSSPRSSSDIAGPASSLEASWKYIVICSVGIALAFLGTVLVYLASLHVGGHGPHPLDWTSLVAQSHRLDPGVMRLAFALIVLGYGTKVGLAPMHSWLPDAHSQAPAPVSALMSGVLLTVAFYAILALQGDRRRRPRSRRSRARCSSSSACCRSLVAASLLLSQRDYKRMLAYHSVEHMGLIALGAAAGSPLAIAAVLLHILGHGLAKGVLFLASGEILLAEGTSEIEHVPALLSRRPVLGGIFAFGLLPSWASRHSACS